MSSEERLLTGNSPLLLDDQAHAWRVVSGRAQMFAVVNGGTRAPLIALDEGDWAFPAPGGGAAHLVMVSVADGTTVAPVGLPMSDPVHGTTATAETRHGIESWLEALGEAVSEPSPADGHPLAGGNDVELDEGTAAWAATRTLWIEAADPDALALFGDTALDEGEPAPAGGVILPLPATAWIRARRTTRVAVVPADEALRTVAGWRGVERFERAVLRRFAARLAAEQDASGAAIEHRVAEQDRLDERTYRRLAGVVDRPRRAVAPDVTDDLHATLGAVAAACEVPLRYPAQLPDGEPLAQAEQIAAASGLRSRRITLAGRWWREDVAPLVATRVDGHPVAILARSPGVVELVDPRVGTRQRVTAAQAQTVRAEALLLYRPLPRDELKGKQLLRFAARSAGRDLWWLLGLGLLIGLMSLAVPLVTKYIFSTAVPEDLLGVVLGLSVLLIIMAAATFGFSVVQRQALARISGRVSTDLEAAVWDRVLDLPLNFFRRFSSGALANRVMAMDDIQALASAVVLTSLLALPLGVFNLIAAFLLQPRMAVVGLVVIVIVIGVQVWITLAQTRRLADTTLAAQASFGVALQFVDGVGKLRVANAERRAFAQWARRFAAQKEAFAASQHGFAMSTAFLAAVTAFATLGMFVAVATLPPGTVSAATFLAFNTAYLQVLAAAVGVTRLVVFWAQAKPLYDTAQPLLTTPREVTSTGQDPGPLNGSIEVSHVTLRYTPDGPTILDDVSFSVQPGGFTALVGPSGSGKSSMLRVLLGFERPELGSVSFDGNDLHSLDVRAVRAQIGVVTQSVRLMPGDIFSNIVGNRQLSLDEAWEAAELAGIADDIRAMPMQMHTYISEGASTFSGGQRQRLLIARAVVAKPRILLFDEATSALDNHTQAHVADAIGGLRASRIVIAHRLSTIRFADQIIVLDGGQIVQAGGFEQLMGSPGPFARLAKRQLITPS